MSEVDIKKIIKEKKVNIGTEKTLKLIKNKKIKNIVISSNCPSNVKRDLKYYAKAYDLQIYEVKENNEELGALFKKPFNISVLSF